MTSTLTSAKPITAGAIRTTEAVPIKQTGNIANDPTTLINDPAPFPADVNGDGVHDVGDFMVFHHPLLRGHMAANCDGNVTPRCCPRAHLHAETGDGMLGNRPSPGCG